MLKSIRRVVTGHDAQGRSIILSDGQVETVGELEAWPGCGTTALWSTTGAPAGNREEDLPQQVTLFPPRGSGGVSFMIMELPPESELDAMSPEQRARATIPVARTFPEAFEIDTSKSFEMHATDTVDYLVVLSGEITLLVDEGEVTLRPFDTVIQRGVNHGWVNRGKVTALIAAVAIDARPLERHIRRVA